MLDSSNVNYLPIKQYNLYIVYYICCLINDNYFDWIKHQLPIVINQINNKNIIQLNKSIFHIIVTIEKTKQNEFINKLYKLFPKQKFLVEFFTENIAEYEGINKVWELGQKHNKKNDIILYYHSKGMSWSKSYNNVDPQIAHWNLESVIKDIKKPFQIFDKFLKIDKIGINCAKGGWVWGNFWYVRGSYINSLEKPIKTERRWYYEDWLGRVVANKKNIITDPDGNERPFCSHSSNNCLFNFYKNISQNCYNLYTYDNLPNIGYYWVPEIDKYKKQILNDI